MELQDIFINKNISIKEVLRKLDETAKKILFVVTEDNKLLGIVTDGDIRRWILRNGGLSEPVFKVMNQSPKFIYEKDVPLAKQIMKEEMIEAIPVLNNNNEVIDIIFWNDRFKTKFKKHKKIDAPVVIMAGGKGTRLEPYTKILPKPLIPIGNTPIVERIIHRFNEFGCSQFYLTVNYKKNMIKAYFNEIEKNYTVEFVEEEKPLGTGGSLYLIKDQLKDTFFVSNCDILIDGDYTDMIEYHKKQENKITLITSLRHYTVPYGIVKIDNESNVLEIVEKPEYDYLVNTGMYILEPECLYDIPENTFYHITELINQYIEKGERVGVYPVSENSWLDMGQFEEMENMKQKLGVE